MAKQFYNQYDEYVNMIESISKGNPYEDSNQQVGKSIQKVREIIYDFNLV